MIKPVTVQFAAPFGVVGQVLSYLDLPLSTGVQPTATDSNCIITSNRQYFSL